ncbi:MAG TPA: hypothetical protein VKH46_14615 [Thermoanaerobaculia bacterium]|jgi:hypothetical protein|nr:hypothetical protein [Thermoanaerobaculia bacterium]
MRRRERRRPGLPVWLAGAALVALAAYLGRRRCRLVLAAVSGALTDRALRALADTFREEESA